VDRGTKITFFTGLENRTFSPRSQQRTHEWFEHFQPGRHEFVGIEDFGHLDVWIRPHAERVYDVVVHGLTR
jgi:hypothetical protein